MSTHTPSPLLRRKQTIIFDFDGTLANIELVFLTIFNRLAPEFGYAPIRPKEIPGIKKLSLTAFLWKRLGLRLLFLPQILRRGREEYHQLAPTITLFPGIQDLLRALRSHGYHIGIVSSSRSDTITNILTKFDIPMDFIYHSGLFNKSKTLAEVMRIQHLSQETCLYVGDEVRDVKACRKIDLDIIAVTWGLNDATTLKATGAPTVDTPSELLDILIASYPAE
ncbi:MAG: HAD-IA family hydrolase [Candidatus Moraniibacteriota bacterium]